MKASARLVGQNATRPGSGQTWIPTLLRPIRVIVIHAGAEPGATGAG